jgi:Plant mobile domain
MYLRFLQDFNTPRNLNWGAAMLACLYRNLSTTSLSRNRTIGGALLLQQHRSWIRFQIARSSPTGPTVQFGGDDEDSRVPFALKWKYYKTYEFGPAHSSLTYYRNEFENMLAEHVNWQPYDSVLAVLPGSFLIFYFE